MPVYHIVLFKFKALAPQEEVQAVCDRLLALKTKCVHPETRKPYVKTAAGGTNHSPEGLAAGFTHGFVMKLDSEEDRDYYVQRDPAHLEFVASIEDIVEEAQVLDFTPGIFAGG